MNIIQIKYFLLGKRYRDRRPLGVVIYSVLILLIPLYYYFKSAGFELFNISDYQTVFSNYENSYYVITIAAVLCFLSLFFVLKIGFFIFFVFSLSFILYNIHLFFSSADIFNIEAVAMAFFSVSAFTYFTSRENSAPYVHGRKKGWRSEIRRHISYTVTINGQKRTIKNINSRGMLIKNTRSDYKIGEQYSCNLTVNNIRFNLKSVAVRIEDGNTAFAFVEMEKSVRLDLYHALKNLEEESARKSEKDE
jgi:hypothetical protein